MVNIGQQVHRCVSSHQRQSDLHRESGQKSHILRLSNLLHVHIADTVRVGSGRGQLYRDGTTLSQGRVQRSRTERPLQDCLLLPECDPLRAHTVPTAGYIQRIPYPFGSHIAQKEKRYDPRYVNNTCLSSITIY